jgi:hypothetical protein
MAGILFPAFLPACGDSLALPGEAEVANLVAVSGGNQIGTPGSQLSQPLVVEAQTSSGQPIRGVNILFRFADDFDGGALSPGAATTGPDGRAGAEVTLGLDPGTQTVEALVEQGSSGAVSVRFRLTALRLDDGGDGDGDGGPGGGGGDGDGDHGGGDDD